MAAPLAYSFATSSARSLAQAARSSCRRRLADEGITIAMTDDKTSMVTGADGSGMFSLHAAKSVG